MEVEFVWVFNGENSRFASGVFTSLENASEWIGRNGLSGVLTKYPLNSGAYDWAIKSGIFTPKSPEHLLPSFIAKFTSAGMEHFHFENGTRE